MANKTILDYTAAGSIDPANDYLLEYQNASGAYMRINRNVLLGVTGNPADLSTAQTFTNKTIGNTNTVTLKDTLFTLQDDGDVTKQAQFQLSGITTATTRTYTLPNASSTLVDLITAQTLTNKTLTSPTITGGAIDNSTITVDSIAGHTSSTTVSVAGLSITSGVITTANSVTNANLQAGIQTSKFSNPYKFRVYRTAAQNTSAGANTIVLFDTKTFDTGSNVDVVTNKGRFTAPVTGFYFFNTALSVVASGTTIAGASLFKNGVQTSIGQVIYYTSAAGTITVVAMDLLQLNAGDYVEAAIFNNGAVAVQTGSSQTFFSGYLVSAT